MTTATEYKNFLDKTSWYTHTDEGSAPELMYLTLGLAGESGEFADAVKKIIRVTGAYDGVGFAKLMHGDGGEEKLLEELGDVLWYLTKLTSFLGTTVEDLMVRNTYKLYNRLIKLDKISPASTPWPFSNPFLSFDKVHEYHQRKAFINGDDDVCVDEKI